MVIYGLYLILIQVYKYYGGLRYPPNVWEMEMAAIVIFIVMQAQRIDLGCRANRNENYKAMLTFTAFTLVVTAFYLYFSLYTTYVLVLDIVCGSVGVTMTTFQFLLGVPATFIFRKTSKL